MSSLPESLVRFRTELEAAIRRNQRAEATARSNGWEARVLRAVRRRPGRTALAFAAVVGAVAAALFFSSPWKNSPVLLEPAQAARFLQRVDAKLTQPAGTILHIKAEWSRTSKRFGCTTTSPDEMWIDEAAAHGWRWITGQSWVKTADSRTFACSHWRTYEVGGDTRDRDDAAEQPIFSRQLEFVPPNTLRVPRVRFPMMGGDSVPYLRVVIRDAIESGCGHDEGMTEIDGHAVRRFRLDCRPGLGPAYMYVNPETFLPVRLETPSGFTNGNIVTGEYQRFDTVWRYSVIEYLPRTAANVALTDIRAQHPDATGP